jgi:hypothetical protein
MRRDVAVLDFSTEPSTRAGSLAISKSVTAGNAAQLSANRHKRQSVPVFLPEPLWREPVYWLPVFANFYRGGDLRVRMTSLRVMVGLFVASGYTDAQDYADSCSDFTSACCDYGLVVRPDFCANFSTSGFPKNDSEIYA